MGFFFVCCVTRYCSSTTITALVVGMNPYKSSGRPNCEFVYTGRMVHISEDIIEVRVKARMKPMNLPSLKIF